MTLDTAVIKSTRPERIDIGDGLIMRWSTKDDVKNIAETMAECFRWIPIGCTVGEGEEPAPNEWVRTGTLRLLRGDHTVMGVNDVAIVENTLAKEGENPIVACTSLMHGPGYYGKVKLQLGKPEAVGCLPEYRNKGLIRHLFIGMIHPASEARGDILQCLPGIPHFYLQFGYEYALRTRNHRILRDVDSKIPKLADNVKEPFTLREPSLADIPYLIRLSTPAAMFNQAQVGTIYDEAYWRYTIHNVLESADTAFDITRLTRIIVDAATGKDAGVVMVFGHFMKTVGILTLDEGYSYREAMYPVLRLVIAANSEPNAFERREASKHTAAAAAGAAASANNDDEGRKHDTMGKPQVSNLGFALDSTHPVSKLLASDTEPIVDRERLYTRIRSYADFIRHVAPELEDRIAASPLKGITVTYHFDFFRKVEGAASKALEIVIENGKIVSTTDDYREPEPRAKMLAARERIAAAKAAGVADKKPLEFKARFAPLTFTRLVVGEASIDEMLDMYSQCDIEGGNEAKMLLDVMFPKGEFHMDLMWW
ncbi:hypothetical protein BG004_006443 [Podila humilis]|nr:hypothetical protein BG004_006443 [Podila humilis]